MGLRSDPVGGGQFKAAAQQIIEAESQPLKAMNARKGKEEARLKLFQEFKSKFGNLDKLIGEIATFRKFRELKVDLGDGVDLMSATVLKEVAEPGQYEIQIDELAARSSSISNGFEDPDKALLGMGFVSMTQIDGKVVETYINDTDSSLRGIAKLVNRNPQSPVQASIIQDENDPDRPWRLLMTARKDGEKNQVDFPEFYFVDGDAELKVNDDHESKNANVMIDGFEIGLGSNDAKDFLPGVNIHLKEARPDRPFTLSITADYPKMAAKVKAIVDQVNTVLQFIVKQNAIDETSDTSTTFAGDSTLQSIEYQIRNMVHRPFRGTDKSGENQIIIHLNEVGIEFDKTGQLSFKEDKFTKVLEGNFELVADAVAGEEGFAIQFRNLLASYTRPSDGLLSTKEHGLRDRMKQIDSQIDQKTRVLERKKQEVTEKFARLQSTIAGLQQQQQYMAATLGSGGGNPISQLLG